MTEKADIKNGTGIRKKRRLWLKILGGIVGALVLFMGIVFVVHVISKGIEKRRLSLTAKPYLWMASK